jgi:hypothetical protein
MVKLNDKGVKRFVKQYNNGITIENFKSDENEQHISHAGVAQLVRARGS